MVALLSMPPRMRLTESDDDRRVFPRKEVRTHAEGRRLDHSVPARQQPHLRLALRDLSMGGLSAVIDVPVMAGERLNVSFPRQGTVGGWDACGRVIRCEPSGMGYRLAVEFDPIPMAA